MRLVTAALVALAVVSTACTSVSSANQPVVVEAIADARDRTAIASMCKQLGGGFVFERRTDGRIGLGRKGERDVSAVTVRNRELRRHGWTPKLYEALWHIDQDYDIALSAGYIGTEEQFSRQRRRALRLLDAMPSC